MGKRLGLVVNPIAGMGGPLGFKGTDGWAMGDLEALAAVPRSSERAAEALSRVSMLRGLEVVTVAGRMGEEAATLAGLTPTIAYVPPQRETTACDTQEAVRAFIDAGCHLLLFAGGDGTARDVYTAAGQSTPVLGIPSGVKMHSGVFAISPAAAGDLAAAFLGDEVRSTSDAEVVDLDEDAYRRGEVSVRLFGYLKVPHRPYSLQGTKVRSSGDDEDIAEIGEGIASRMEPGVRYAIGPGTTAKAALRALGLPYTLLGVDLVLDRQVVGQDLSAAELLAATEHRPTKVVVSPIGGQGHVFGRGNQQLSPELIRRVGKAGIIIAASPLKLSSMHGRPLFVDTGDRDLDRELTGYARVVAGRNREVVYVLSN